LDLWANAVKRMAGEDVTPVAAPDPRDKRFAEPEWSTNQFFDFLKHAYLLTVQWANRLVREAEGLGPDTLHKADNYVLHTANARSRTRSRPRASCWPSPSCWARRSPPGRKISCADCTCWPRTSRPDTASSESASPARRCSRSGAPSR